MYFDEGWQVQILRWAVGVRCLLDSETTKCYLKFFKMLWQPEYWRRIIEDTSKESAKAFYSLHCVRCKSACKALRICPWSIRMRTTQNKAGASNNRSYVFDAYGPGRACDRKRRRRSNDDINDAQAMEAEGGNDAEEGLMAYGV